MTELLPLLEAVVAMRGGEMRAASLAVVESTIRRGEMPPLHAHDEDEAFYVLEGSIVLHAGDETVRLQAGDAFVAQKGLPHTHRAESENARYLTMTFARSVGRYEDFLRAVGRPATAEPGWASGEEEAAVAAMSHADGIAILGAPGALPASREGFGRSVSG